jgi:hypothetical protein
VVGKGFVKLCQELLAIVEGFFRNGSKAQEKSGRGESLPAFTVFEVVLLYILRRA